MHVPISGFRPTLCELMNSILGSVGNRSAGRSFQLTNTLWSNDWSQVESKTLVCSRVFPQKDVDALLASQLAPLTRCHSSTSHWCVWLFLVEGAVAVPWGLHVTEYKIKSMLFLLLYTQFLFQCKQPYAVWKTRSSSSGHMMAALTASRFPLSSHVEHI